MFLLQIVAEKAVVSVKDPAGSKSLAVEQFIPMYFACVELIRKSTLVLSFGVGLERIALLKYEIDDMRLLYENDIRFLKQF